MVVVHEHKLDIPPRRFIRVDYGKPKQVFYLDSRRLPDLALFPIWEYVFKLYI